MIINYELTEDMLRNQFKQYFQLRIKKPFITFMVMLGVAVLLIVFGYTVAKKYEYIRILGYVLLLISIVFCILLPSMCKGVLKSSSENFKMNSENGKALMKVEITNDTLSIINETKGNVHNIARKDILSFTEFKDIIIVQLVTKQYTLLPNLKDIKDAYYKKIIDIA